MKEKKSIVAGMLALLLLAISGVGSLTLIENSYAMGGSILARPSPKPRPTQLEATPSPVLSSTVEATSSPVLSPTVKALPTGGKRTPVASPTGVLGVTGEHTGSPPSGQSGGPSLIVIFAISLFGLLLFISIAWFILLRILLPPMDAKRPPSGALPWSRTRIPNPESQGGVSEQATTEINKTMI